MNWQMEVIELHRFFEAWLLGREETLGFKIFEVPKFLESRFLSRRLKILGI